MEIQGELLYTGKTKQVFTTDNPEQIIIHYKDDALAYNGIKRAQIANKGVLNNKISSLIYNKLEEDGFNTHFIIFHNEISCIIFSCKLTYTPIIQNEDHVRKNSSQLYIFAPETHFFKKKAGINPSFASDRDRKSVV